MIAPRLTVAVFSFESQTYPTLVAGCDPSWLPDGKHLVFADDDSHGISRYDLDRREATQILSAKPDSVGGCAVSRDGHWLYFDRQVEDGDVWLMDL